MEWYEDRDTVQSVAEVAVDYHMLTMTELLRFYAKPWNYPECHQAWLRHEEATT